MEHLRAFAITARAVGNPKKLYTPIVVLNSDTDSGLVATTVNASWDTGAEFCIMSRSLAAILGYNFKNKCNTQGLTGSEMAPIGYAHISLVANGGCLDTIAAVVDETSPTGDYSFIIGMDIIRRGTLAISSSPVETILSFRVPPGPVIDFVESAGEDVTTAYVPLSSTVECIRPVFGQDVIKLLYPKLQR